MTRWGKRLAFLATVALMALAAACAAPEETARGPAGASGEGREDIALHPGAMLSEIGGELGTAAKRMIVRTIDMTLVVSNVADSLQGVALLAQEMDGFVVSSLISGEDEATTSASTSIRVPEEAVEETLGRLRGMALRVPREQSNAQDVTEEYVDLTARLGTLEAAEQQLVKLMDRAETVEDVLKVQRELTSMREQVESLKGRIQYLERTSATSLISVSLLPAESEQPLSHPGWSALETVKEAVRGLSGTAQGLADAGIWLAIFSPLWAPLAAVGIWAARRWARGHSSRRPTQG